MKFELAQKLYDKLLAACPVDTGQLKGSIQMLQLDAQEWVIIIGNEDGSINGTPSNQYASVTNNFEFLTFNSKKGSTTKPNPNYHWINNAVLEWAQENMINIKLEMEEEV